MKNLITECLLVYQKRWKLRTFSDPVNFLSKEVLHSCKGSSVVLFSVQNLFWILCSKCVGFVCFTNSKLLLIISFLEPRTSL